MELLEYLSILRRRWAVILIAALLGALAAWATTPPAAGPTAVKTLYSATHTLLQEIESDFTQTTSYSPARAQLFATTGEVPKRVVERLDLDIEPAVLASRVTVTADPELGTVQIAATSENGAEAATLANTFAEELLAYFQQQAAEDHEAELLRLSELQSDQEERVRELDEQINGSGSFDSAGDGEGGVDADVDLLIAERDALIRQFGITYDTYQQLLTGEKLTAGYTTLEEATPVPSDIEGFQAPAERGPRVLLGAGLGLLFGLVLALVLERLDTKVRTRRGAEEVYRLPVVTEVPRIGFLQRRSAGVVTVTDPASVPAEAYRILRLSLQLMPRWILPQSAPGSSQPDAPATSVPAGPGSGKPRDGAGVILVTSAGPAEGKTTTVANLAASFAEGGRSVIVLDCDFHGGDLHRYFGLQQEHGVRDYLSRQAGGGQLAEYAKATGLAGVRVVTSGTETLIPGELVGPGQELIRAASHVADVVLVDAGPILAVNDPAALIPAADAVVVVCRSGRTSVEGAARTSELLARIHAPVVGVALIGVPRGTQSGPSRSHYSYSRPTSRRRVVAVPKGEDSSA